MKKTIEQERAKKVWELLEQPDVKIDDEFKAAANGASALIQNVGFGQAVAFWLKKGQKANKLVNLLAQCLPIESSGPEHAKDLMQRIINIDQDEYRLLTAEAYAYLFWIKRFVNAKAA